MISKYYHDKGLFLISHTKSEQIKRFFLVGKKCVENSLRWSLSLRWAMIWHLHQPTTYVPQSLGFEGCGIKFGNIIKQSMTKVILMNKIYDGIRL